MEFEIKSGKIHVTDPCYSLKFRFGAYNLPATKGIWQVRVKYADNCLGYRVAEFSAMNSNIKTTVEDWIKQPYWIGVDSGQAGVFDSMIYPMILS